MARKILTSNTNSQGGNLHYYHLPMGMVMLTIRRTEQGEIQMDPPTVSYLPDPNARYFFSYRPSAFTDDDITIEFNEQGFLSRMHTLVDDQLDDFITKTFELGTAIVEGAVGIGGMKTRSIGSLAKVLFSGTIDPFDQNQIDEVNAAIGEEGLEFKIVPLKKENKDTNQVPEDGYGIYSRPMDLFNLELIQGNSRIFKTVSLPNPNETHFIEIPSPGMVKTEFQIKFNGLGYPTFINIKKPSTALAIIQLPLTIIRSIIELPTKLIQLRVNMDSSKANEIQNQINLRKIQEQYDALDKQTAASDSGGAAPNQNQFANQGSRGLGSVNSSAVDTGKIDELENDLNAVKSELNATRNRITDNRLEIKRLKENGSNNEE